jgi:hypothetical protein
LTLLSALSMSFSVKTMFTLELGAGNPNIEVQNEVFARLITRTEDEEVKEVFVLVKSTHNFASNMINLKNWSMTRLMTTAMYLGLLDQEEINSLLVEGLRMFIIWKLVSLMPSQYPTCMKTSHPVLFSCLSCRDVA